MTNLNDIRLSVFPLFPSPLGIAEVLEDCSDFKKIITDYKFKPTIGCGSQGCFITERLNILEDFPREKNIIIQYFNFYKNDFLKYNSQEFQMTTSWATKTSPKGFSRFHNHMNCVYSGIFYFDEVDSGDLEFESYGIYPQQILLQTPSEWEIFNSRSWTVVPRKNMIVFFPSYLYHRVTENKSSKFRHSIAFNFFPKGLLGDVDSSMQI